jgi:hypothetical protein
VGAGHCRSQRQAYQADLGSESRPEFSGKLVSGDSDAIYDADLFP